MLMLMLVEFHSYATLGKKLDNESTGLEFHYVVLYDLIIKIDAIYIFYYFLLIPWLN